MDDLLQLFTYLWSAMEETLLQPMNIVVDC